MTKLRDFFIVCYSILQPASLLLWFVASRQEQIFEFHPGDRPPVDLIGAIGDPKGPHPGPGRCQDRVLADPKSSVDLEGPVDHLQTQGRNGDLYAADELAGPPRPSRRNVGGTFLKI